MHGCRCASMPPPWSPDPAARPLPMPAARHPASGAITDHMHTMTGECTCRAARGREGRAGGAQSKQEDRRFHTPESR